MDYTIYHIQLREPARRDELIAFLAETDIEAYQETDAGFDAYAPATADADIRAALGTWQTQYPHTYTTENLPYRNWNEEWEANFTPVIVDDFAAIRASFHPPQPGVEHELLIEPRMAFGTGHHATTFMVLQLMREIDWAGRRVFDYGCGTGVLAILASRLGADPVIAVDIEHESYLNTLDNAAANGVENLQVFEGRLEAVPAGEPYDIILANINRNVILDSLPSLYQQLHQDGQLLISGILVQDRQPLFEALQETGFSVSRERERDGWLAVVVER